MPKVYPAFLREAQLFHDGFTLIAGIDEVGRGCWAGPVVAAALLVTPELPHQLPRVTDSKTVTASERQGLAKELQKRSPGIGYGQASPAEIDQLGIHWATRLAMLRAYWQLPAQPQHTLIDGRPIPAMPPTTHFLIDGDQRSYAIAAASIVAKVYRDTLMATTYHQQYPAYGFDRHVGYGTKLHQQALQEHGPSPIHRFSFAPVQKYQHGAS